VTYQGGQDAGTLEYIDWSITREGQTTKDNLANAGRMGVAGSVLTVGSTVNYAAAGGASYSGRDHVVGVAHFTDGSDQVILDNFV